MIRNITIGQYYAADSVVHRLDPRVKVVGTLVYIVSLFLFNNFWGYAVAVGCFYAVTVMSKVPFSYIVRGLKPVFLMLVFTALLNLFWTPGTAFLQLGAAELTWEGLRKAVFMSLRLIFLILGSSLMTLTTTPNQLTDALEKLLAPLRHLHVPVHEIAMMMSIALRFIPILVEETDRIMKAQMARGADFESGNMIQRLRNMLPILVPLFVSAVHRANDLALAMDARCYHGGSGRTKMHPLRYQGRDFAAYLICIAYCVLLYSSVTYLPML
ncbi:MAG: energy-coupling factor transporter transmembrane protein EcfT [Lachnospiraceae bacterium]|nr:energy-coupling factor transporter transmembrane protein EcfT [Lachnospiraceae bacterium]